MLSMTRRKSGPITGSAMAWIRRIAYRATESSTPDMRPDTGAGAWLCASGSQLCIGAKPALVANPRIASAPPALISAGSNGRVVALSENQDSVGCPALLEAA